MMTDEQKSRVVELKVAIAATAGTLSGAPGEVRGAVVELKRDVHRGGTTARELAKELGVHESTLCRWEREVRARGDRKKRARDTASAGESSFRAVTLTAPEGRSAALAPARMTAVGSLRVAHAPSGLVVDGLDVESLAELLRRMS